MKKLVSLLVVLAMVLSFAPAVPVAHAATHDAPSADTAKTNNLFQETLETVVGNFKDMVSMLKPAAVNSEGGSLALGMNKLEAGVDLEVETVEYSYVAEQTGTLYLTVVAYGDMNADWGTDVFRYPGDTSLAVNGQVITSFEMSLSVMQGDEVKIALSSLDGFYWYAKLHLSYEGPYVPTLGSEETPVELTYDAVASQPYTIEIPAGETFWFRLKGLEFDSSVIEVRGQNAFVSQRYKDISTREWVEQRFDAVDGVVTFNPCDETIRIGNAGNATANYTISASIPEGLYDNPADLPVDKDPATIAVGVDGEYMFEWIASESGTLLIELAGENWFCVLRNRTKGTYEDYAAAWDDSNIMTVDVSQGDHVTFTLGTLAFNEAGEAVMPASSITVSAFMNRLALDKNEVAVEAGATVERTWTATQNGLLVITMDSDNWSYSVSNVTAGVNGQVHYSNQENPVYMEVVKVTVGDAVKVTVATADNTAGTVTFNAALCQGTAEDPIYVDFLESLWNDRENYFCMHIQMPEGTYTMSGWAGSPMVLLFNGAETEVIPTADAMDFYTPPTFEVTVTDASSACKLEVTYPLGHQENPQQMNVGDSSTGAQSNLATVPGRVSIMEPGTYCVEWIAAEDTLLVLNMLGEAWSVSFMVYSTDNRWIYDSVLTSDAAFLVTAEVLKLNAGERVVIILQNEEDEPCDVSFTAYAAAGTAEDPALLDFAFDEASNTGGLNVILPAGEFYYGGFGIGGMNLIVNDEPVAVTAGNRWMGVPDTFVINNEEGAPYIYEMLLGYPVGNMMNAAEAVLGTNVADIAAGAEQGYFYSWVASAYGTLTVTVSGDNGWMYAINNVTRSRYGDIQYSDNGSSTTTIEVKAGDEIQINVSTYNPITPNFAPAGQVTVTLEFTAKEHECVIVDIPGKAATCTEEGLTDGKKCDLCGTVIQAQETIPKTAHTEEIIPGKAATCTEKGLTEGMQCSVCGQVTQAQRRIAKLAHTEQTIPGKAATCTKEGYTEGKECSVCHKLLQAQETIAKTAHTEQTVLGKAASCTEEGLTEGKNCSVCGEVLQAQKPIPMNAHTEEIISGKSATCIEEGLTEGKKCSVCDTVTKEQKTIAKTGHSWTEATCTAPKTCSVCKATEGTPAAHDMGDWTQTKAPTETEKGEETRKCKNCDYSETREVAALGHTCAPVDVAEVPATCTTNGTKAHKKCACGKLYVDGKEVTAADLVIPASHKLADVAEVAATCTTEGTKAHQKCSACGKLFVNGAEVAAADLVITAPGHKWGEWTQIKAPTETEKGEEKRVCETCKAEEKREVAALSHTCAPVDVAEVPATCTTNGTKAHKKCACGKLFVDGKEVTAAELVITAPGHKWTEATCTAPKTCSACGATEGEKKGHTEETIPGKAATCTEPGLTDGKKCSVCGETIEAQKEIPAKGHTFVDGKCECGATEEVAVLMGDVNGDGKVNTTDAKLIMQLELGLIDATKLNVAAADVNGDGKVNTTDAKLIMQLELGLITEFPTKK